MADAVLAAVHSKSADMHLRIAVLTADLESRADHAPDELLRIHHALSHSHHTLGDNQLALQHGIAELPLRVSLQGADHPDTLTTRNMIAVYTLESGNAAEALRLFEALLPNRARVLGAADRGTLATRDNIASSVGHIGHAAGALRLFEALLPDRIRVLGPDDPETLRTRNNIALVHK